MIPRGLKVGDTFTEDNKTYKVLEIVEEGYISTKIADTAEIPEEVVVEEKPATRGRRKKS